MYLYILREINSNTYYIGITSDPKRRLTEHNTNSNHYTGKNSKIWEMVFIKFYVNKTDARKEELRLKKAKNKKYLEWYIANMGQ
jgi:putative endonuclease